jgi:uncharacterized RDD family membrane protein YckC
MIYDLQKASMWKRISAWLFDGIMTGILAVGLALVLSAILGYDQYDRAVDAAFDRYEAQYGVVFDLSVEAHQSLTEEEQLRYTEAYEALLRDADVMYQYNMLINLSMVIITLSILICVFLWEFLIPLFLGNGQTLGKKIFSLCLVRNDGVQVNNLQLFTRALLGRFTLDTMLPVYILLMLFWGSLDLIGLVVLGAWVLAQILVPLLSATNGAVHDLLAGTAVVDISSQMIFRSTEELIAYKKKIHAEMASRPDYE